MKEKLEKRQNRQFTEKQIQIAHTIMKRCSTFLQFNEILKDQQHDILCPSALAKVKQIDHIKWWQEYGETVS